MTTLSLPGRMVALTDADKAENELLRDFGISIQQRQDVLGVVRGQSLDRAALAVDEYTVVELRFDGDVVQYISIEELRAESTIVRGAAQEIVEVPVQFRRGPSSSRGVFDWVLKGLRIFKVENPLAVLAEEKIVERFDDSQTPPPGLYHAGRDGELVKPVTSAEDLDIARPWLLFIHGTASSTEGSFGGLFGDKNDPTANNPAPGRQITPEWKQLRDVYGDRILALQHKTLSVSPVENALYAAKLLPKNATLHMVTHSRGGLVGELLALGVVDQPNLAAYGTSYGDASRRQLEELIELLRQKNFDIEKFVRVACPARGTILVSKRLDLYLSILLNLFGAIPALKASPLFTLLKATTIELVRMRTDVTKLPGLEAQMPESAFIHFLNQGLQSKSRLAVIAGDAEGDTFWQRLKLLGTDLFYREEHDLVVNTAAMFGGMGRTEPAYGFYHRGAVVNHFNYFRNERTRARLYAWLTSKEPDPEFQIFDPTRPGITVNESRGAAGASLPVTIIIPDLFGTMLGVDAKSPGKSPFWPDVASIARNGFELHKKTYVPTGVVNAYEALYNALSATSEVVAFAWDWRKSMATAADELARKILSYTDRDIRLIGHGAGGVIAQLLAAAKEGSQEKAWKVTKRVLLLGSPYRGMFAAVDWCSPQSRLVRLLRLADGVRSTSDIAEQLSACAAIVELAPDDFLQQPDRWKAAGAVPQSKDSLQKPLELRNLLQNMPAGVLAKFTAVAGRAAETLVAADGAGKISISRSGDGRVIVAQMHETIPLRRVEAEHGDLLTQGGAFDAYRELLDTGNTAALPLSQRVAVPPEPQARLEEPLLFPQNDDLLDEAIGTRRDGGERQDYPLSVSVTHGDLRVARYPVAVGHYLGDMLVSAEATLDFQLERRLSRRFQLGLYPGKAGSVEVVRMPNASPPGALVIGLGQVGSVTLETVRRGIAAAASRYALSVAEDASGASNAGQSWRSAAFSAVMIGTKGGSSMTGESSITAVLRGALDVNRMLRAQSLWDKVRIDAIEFIELYEERAIASLHSARNVARQLRNELEPEERIEVVQMLRTTRSGQFRVPLDDEQAGWWQRLFITVESPEHDPAKRASAPMRYVVLSERARVEAQLQCRESNATDHLIASAIATHRYDPALSGALFELLVPNEIKSTSDQAPSVVLILDRDTAKYPWELLADPYNKDGLPYAVRTGMLRQFIDPDFRHSPRYSSAKAALVVGDALIEGPVGTDKERYPELHGAQAEARAVAIELGAANYNTTLLVRCQAKDIQTSLFTRPYRILHLAGHGRYDPKKPEESGMIIGDNHFLTACQLRQLRTVPDLVFLNCCFLGTIDAVPAGGNPHLLAASIANELISLGVKAIIAAGWAVDDGAAVTFASTFYEEMLANRRKFGEAVRTAREQVFRKHGATNTWGAYQCYGNPGFMLADVEADASGDKAFEPCSQREYLDALRSLSAEVGQSPQPQTAAALKQRLEGITSQVPLKWKDAELLAFVARAWRDLGDYQQACDAFEQAFARPEARMPIDAVEQLANMRVRLSIDDPKRRDEHVNRARQLLDALLLLGQSSERLSLVGSMYKKLAGHAKSRPERNSWLAEAAKAYLGAVAIDEKTGSLDPYPLLNAANVQWLLNRSDATLVKRLQACEAIVQAGAKSDDYWKRAGAADFDLTRALQKNDLKPNKIAKLYADAASTPTSATEAQRLSSIEHIEFLANMLDGNKLRKEVQKELKSLARQLRGTWSAV